MFKNNNFERTIKKKKQKSEKEYMNSLPFLSQINSHTNKYFSIISARVNKYHNTSSLPSPSVETKYTFIFNNLQNLLQC